MKLLRFGLKGHEIPGIVDDNGDIRSLEGVVDDVNGEMLNAARLEKIKTLDLTTLPLAPNGARIGPCVGNVGKFIGIGLNYSDHAADSGMTLSDEPEVFTKATSAICGPNEHIIKARNSTKLDWEVELALVIGKEANYVSEEEATDYIAGYCVCNDVSERAFQLERGSNGDKDKGCDTFGAIGPWLVTSDEVGDPANLDMWLEVNGQRYQNGSSRTMVFKPAFIVSYLSQFMSLQPGDVISTGTPSGLGLGQKPSIYLNVGDKIKLGIEKLGMQTQTVINVS